MSQLHDALKFLKIKISKINLEKQRPVSTNLGTMSIDRFCKMMLEKLGGDLGKFPELIPSLHDHQKCQELLEEYGREEDVLVDDSQPRELPEELKDLKLNMNLAAKRGEDRFFLTHRDETVSRISGDSYLLLAGKSPLEAAAQARKVLPEYHPRGKAGCFEVTVDGRTETVFNLYTPPSWTKHTKPMPDKLPPLFEKLVTHLFPRPEERAYFFAWLHESMFRRAYVFLILCGAPGTGKNRLKLVLRALHGHVNTTDGKKSTLTERFNSQLSESTLAWFDELKYDAEMENTMKELQNDSISIERKGVDATRGTKIHASIVISNNKPRDNYIAFDARKFAPLVVTSKRLEESMTPDEIDELTQKVEDATSSTFDPAFLAQIAQWVKRHGRSKKWPNLEYRGPMFWTLAHTSMAQWQKRAVLALMECVPESYTHGGGYDKETGMFLWSQVQSKLVRKQGDKGILFPDFTSVRAFFEVFRDGRGRKSFETAAIEGNILGDFWVRAVYREKIEVITESTMKLQGVKSNAKKVENKKTKAEYLDL